MEGRIRRALAADDAMLGLGDGRVVAADGRDSARLPTWSRFTAVGVGVGLVLFVTLALVAAQLGGFGVMGPHRRAAHVPDISLLAAAPTMVKIHLLAILAAIALGAVMLLSRKGRRFHRVAGWIWSGMLGLAAASSLFIDGLSDGRWSYLHLTAGWVLLVLPLALWAAHRHHARVHGGLMMWLFFGSLLITGAFAFLPGRLLWRMVFG